MDVRLYLFFCLKNLFTFTNSIDPDEAQHHCLQKYSIRGSRIQRVNDIYMAFLTHYYLSLSSYLLIGKKTLNNKKYTILS